MVGTELFEATLYLYSNTAAANPERTDVTLTFTPAQSTFLPPPLHHGGG